ncbi:PPPDE putative peptidase domain-domain-containing protein [Tuber borchii]|uniref:PPPDE putative peptidase domain-domain-containing protein n=1 Tax=Tuber borchii TaxID=42251 RepID=A0A2T7A1A1_TUBBO|nr:PPPDE putative peptidase domain-domain-containing protein [Tuber borchii]
MSTDSGERLVQLYVYDLSQGMAREMSLGLLGVQIDAVYHTSIVVGGKEYYYGHGIQYSQPGKTHHGNPMEVEPLGVTALPDDVILGYLDSLKSIYSPEAYDLFVHNCNNFTNDVAQFLCGRGIPAHITSLPQTVLNTPFGQMLRPMLDRAIRPITTAPNMPPADGAFGTAPQGPSRVVVANSLHDLETTLKSAESSCAVIFFTSATCPPCKVIYPRFEKLSSEAGDKAKFIKVDISTSYGVGQKFQIPATPTFMTFLKGERVDQWSGANYGDLASRVETLLKMAYPPHPHTNVNLRVTLSTSMSPVTFTKVPPLDKVIEKLGPTGKNPIVTSIKEFIALRDSQGAIEAPLRQLSDWATFLQESFTGLPAATLFPLVDLFRVTLSDPRVSGWFAEEKGNATIKAMLSSVTNHTSVPYPLRLVTLQATCNLFTSSLFPAHLTSPSLSHLVISLVTTSLLDKSHTNARVAAASLAFNLATHVQKQRAVHNEEALQDVEFMAAVVEALKEEKDSKEVVKGLVLAVALVSYCAPLEGEILELLKVLEASEVLNEKAKVGMGDKALCQEVAKLLEV